jgi:microcystin-dependent protein
MSDQFLGEIRIFAGNYAPIQWALCAGQILPISQYSALFALIGTYYGGNGTSNFALPDLRGRVPMFWGQGPGLSDYVIGEQDGSESVTLTLTELPAHTHAFNAGTAVANAQTPASNTVITRARMGSVYQTVTNQNMITLAPGALAPVGNSLPHENRMPFLALNFIIALQGIFPPRG